jgi:hypothetical protein
MSVLPGYGKAISWLPEHVSAVPPSWRRVACVSYVFRSLANRFTMPLASMWLRRVRLVEVVLRGGRGRWWPVVRGLLPAADGTAFYLPESWMISSRKAIGAGRGGWWPDVQSGISKPSGWGTGPATILFRRLVRIRSRMPVRPEPAALGKP